MVTEKAARILIKSTRLLAKGFSNLEAHFFGGKPKPSPPPRIKMIKRAANLKIAKRKKMTVTIKISKQRERLQNTQEEREN